MKRDTPYFRFSLRTMLLVALFFGVLAATYSSWYIGRNEIHATAKIPWKSIDESNLPIDYILSALENAGKTEYDNRFCIVFSSFRCYEWRRYSKNNCLHLVYKVQFDWDTMETDKTNSSEYLVDCEYPLIQYQAE